MRDPSPLFFADQRELRHWLLENADSTGELWVGLYKKDSGKASIIWPQLVDELLCFGWIDGLRRTMNEDSYAIRVTPRRERSNWSQLNTERAQLLIDLGLMTPAGRAVFESRDRERSAQNAQERDQARLSESLEEEFRANQLAWGFFSSQPPGYRKTAISWAVSAKRDDTRRRRLATLIEDSGNGSRIAPLRRKKSAG